MSPDVRCTNNLLELSHYSKPCRRKYHLKWCFFNQHLLTDQNREFNRVTVYLLIFLKSKVNTVFPVFYSSFACDVVANYA